MVYIAGYGRSGSTLLDLLLGRLDGWFSMGEFRLFWHALRDDWRCGCGATVAECPVWSEVVARVQPLTAPEVIAAYRETVRIRRVPGLLRAGNGHAARRRAHDVLGDAIARTYAASAAVTGARVLVDSSKDPVYGLVTARALDIPVHVVHLVRDSRAVAWSWQRTRVRPEISRREAYMPQRAPWKTSLDWDLRNALSHPLGRRAASYTRITYEALAQDPQATVTRIAAALGESTTATTADAVVNHTVGGNPVRFRGEVTIRPDEEWQEALGAGDRRLVTALTWPLLRAYGYR